MEDTCPKCGHDLADHDGGCNAETNLGGDPPAYKSCACLPDPPEPIIDPIP